MTYDKCDITQQTTRKAAAEHTKILLFNILPQCDPTGTTGE